MQSWAAADSAAAVRVFAEWAARDSVVEAAHDAAEATKDSAAVAAAEAAWVMYKAADSALVAHALLSTDDAEVADSIEDLFQLTGAAGISGGGLEFDSAGWEFFDSWAPPEIPEIRIPGEVLQAADDGADPDDSFDSLWRGTFRPWADSARAVRTLAERTILLDALFAAREAAEATKGSAAVAVYEGALGALYPWLGVEPGAKVRLAAMKAREALDAVNAAAVAWAAVSGSPFPTTRAF